MASSVLLAPLDFPGYVTDLDGDPLASGWLTFLEPGTTTPQDTYADCNGDAVNTNPLQLDSSGLYVCFLLPTAYDIVVSEYDPDNPTVPGADLYTRSGYSNPGQIVAASSGTIAAEGSQNVVSGYSVLSTDNLVTVSSTGGANPCIVNLPAASARVAGASTSGLPITIKNMGTVPLAVTPAGADTIDGIAAAYAVAASSSPLFRTITLCSDGSSAWWLVGGIGV